MKNKRIFIIGSGAAGLAAQRALPSNCSSFLLTEERHPPYSACVLPNYIGGSLLYKDVMLPYSTHPPHYLLLSTKVEGVDPKKGALYTSKGAFEYDGLILATGSRPFIPPIPGIKNHRIYTLKSLDDGQKIRKRLSSHPGPVVVIGGGAIGLETATALSLRGVSVTLIEISPSLLPQKVTKEVSQYVEALLKRWGIKLYLGSKVKEIVAQGDRLFVKVLDKSIICSMVIVAAGMRPHSSLAKDTGLKLTPEGSIVVDEYMQTSKEGIFSCGDAVTVIDHKTNSSTTAMLWGVATRQGQVAGKNMNNLSSSYAHHPPVLSTQVFNSHIITHGDYHHSFRKKKEFGSLSNGNWMALYQEEGPKKREGKRALQYICEVGRPDNLYHQNTHSLFFKRWLASHSNEYHKT